MLGRAAALSSSASATELVSVLPQRLSMASLRLPFSLLGSVALLLAMSACGGDARHQARPPTTDAVGTAATLHPARNDGHRAVCDSVAALWEQMADVKVARADTTITPYSAGTPVQACRVAMVAPAGLPNGAAAKSYWADSTFLSTFRGWRMLTRWEAEGPDGFSRTLVRSSVRCQIDFEQDGGDDSDSTYVPSPSIAERTTCWRDAAGATTRGTATYSAPAVQAGR
jgi:hypothetical protein